MPAAGELSPQAKALDLVSWVAGTWSDVQATNCSDGSLNNNNK